MTLEEMKQHEWDVSWSGGKDSTATIILMHENNIPIKKIIYVRMMYDETLPATLPVMTDFVDRASKVFEGWGYEVEYVYTERTMMDIAKKTYKKSKYKQKIGKPYGITALSRRRCNLTLEKQKAIKKITNTDCFQMIGYAVDEKDRLIHIKDDEKKQSIMAELNVKEQDAFDICKKHNLLSPLYDLGIKRDGCWFCPNAGKREREIIITQYPELYKKIVELIEMPGFDIRSLKTLNNWLIDYYDTKDGENDANTGNSNNT